MIVQSNETAIIGRKRKFDEVTHEMPPLNEENQEASKAQEREVVNPFIAQENIAHNYVIGLDLNYPPIEDEVEVEPYIVMEDAANANEMEVDDGANEINFNIDLNAVPTDEVEDKANP
ncbi:hypothetical protein RJT34_30336 [Clitoria ternatea]|uniref:Uncharacterized protein n=1 Tax=Clitoria ternatea TaxID=43366 RepID=A0AAN9EUD7_CLITE